VILKQLTKVLGEMLSHGQLAASMDINKCPIHKMPALKLCDRIRDPTGVATKVVGMEERWARFRQEAAASQERQRESRASGKPSNQDCCFA
jgi:hypothetical protein